MHILAMNISQTVTDNADITIAFKQEVAYQSINQSIKFIRRRSSVAVKREAVLDNESEAPKRNPAAVSCTPSRTSEFLVDDGIQ